MKKIFTFGSCISRDVFNHTSEDEFDVTLNIQRMSYALMPLEGYPITYEELDMEYLDDFPWEVKMMIMEISKTCLEKAVTSDADYLVMDLIEERFDFAEFTIGKKLYRCVKSGHFDNFYDKYLADKVTDYTETSIDEYTDKEVEEMFDKSITTILKRFAIDKIIMIETYYARKMIDNKGNITEFENKEEISDMNKRLHRVYKIMKMVLDKHSTDEKNYNLITADEDILGNADHKWGPFPVHYVDEFYENVGESIKIITNI